MMIQLNKVTTFVYMATFNSLPAARAFYAEMLTRPLSDKVMDLKIEDTTVVWRLDDALVGREWGKDFESNWLKKLEKKMSESKDENLSHIEIKNVIEHQIENEIISELKD